MKFFPLFLLTLLLLLGCDSSRNLAELCKENPEICQDFTEDSWCKSERGNVVRNRIAVKTNDENLHKYHLLIAYEDYIKCVSLAAQIEHIKLKEKTTRRKNNLYKAQAQLAELTADVANSKHPHLLFYRWTRESDNNALAQFLRLEGSAELENSISQHNLATYYVKKDINKTLGLLFRALELQQPQEKIIPETLETLATIFLNKEKPKQAYIWLKTYELTQNKKTEGVALTLKQLEKNYNLDSNFLNQVATNTLNKIKKGEFKTPKY